MAGPYLAILFLIGILSTGYGQRYDEETNLEWQSGRLQRGGSNSQFTQSSPLVPRDSINSRENVPAVRQRSRRPPSGTTSFENEGTRGNTRRTQSRASSPEARGNFNPEPQLVSQRSSEAIQNPVNRVSNRRPTQTTEATANGQSVPEYQRSRFRPSRKESDVTPQARQTGGNREKVEHSIERPKISDLPENIVHLTGPSNEERKQKFASEVQRNADAERTRPRSSRPSSPIPRASAEREPQLSIEKVANTRPTSGVRFNDAQSANKYKNELHAASGETPSAKSNSLRQRAQLKISTASPLRRGQTRRPSYRGGSSIKPTSGIERGFRQDAEVKLENEVLKSQKMQGRTQPPQESNLNPSSQAEKEQTNLFTTAIPQETIVQDSIVQEEETTQKPIKNRFQLVNSKPLGSRRPLLISTAPPTPPKRSSSKSTSLSRENPLSREETQPPPEPFNKSLGTVVTEGYTDAVLASTENIRGTARGNDHRMSNTSPARKRPFRGEVKSQLSRTLDRTNGDEISEEDNYPKEFIEKIKASEERTQSSREKPAPKSQLKGRALGGRSLAHRTSQKSHTKRHMDSDVSESIHEEVMEQELPTGIKPRENRYYQRTRNFSKTKVTSTTTPPPLTTKETPKFTQQSNVDGIRQKYLDKLKQSQEERIQKLANLRPKLLKEGETARIPGKSQTIEPQENTVIPKKAAEQSNISQTVLKPLNPYSRRSKFDTSKSFTGSFNSSGGIKFRPRFSSPPRVSESSIEAAIPTISEYSRTKNRYSRLRKEELSVEAPEAKSWTISNKLKSADATSNFIRLRTKDLTPLGSERFEETVADNEILEIPSTPSTTSTTDASSTESSTVTAVELTTTQSAIASATIVPEFTTTIKLSAESSELRSSLETSLETFTSEANIQDRVAAGSTTLMTDPPEEKSTTLSTITEQQVTVSTRHRFSSRYVGSTDSQTFIEQATMEPIVFKDDLSSTLSILNSFTSSPSDLSTLSTSTSLSSITTTERNDDNSSVINSSLSSRSDNLPSEAIPAVAQVSLIPADATPNASTTTTVKSEATTIKNKTKLTPKTTTVPSFLNNRPILRNIVNLLSPSSTTTKKPKSKSKPKAAKATNKAAKKPGKSKTTTVRPIALTTVTSRTSNVTPSTINSENTTVNPLPLAISAEEVINDTKEIISNKTSFGSAFSIAVPRAELDALTPESLLNTTESPPATLSTTETRNITSQPVYFEYTSPTPPRRVEIPQSTPSTTTAGDYYVFGIYPNNTVVKKRAWKAFDYEKYMSPYVIFGIYPNNTIVKKFPNGTIINDEFMTSDNEIKASTQFKTYTPPSSSPSSVSPTPPSTETSPLTSFSTKLLPQSTTTSAEDEDSSSETTPQLSEEGITSVTFGMTDASDGATTISPELSDSTTTESMTESTMNDFLFDPVFLRSGFILDETTDSPQMTSTSLSSVTSTVSETVTAPLTSTITTPMTTAMTTDETTVDPSLNLVLPLTIEEVQTFWNGNFSDTGDDSQVKSRFFAGSNANALRTEKDPISITNLAFRVLSTSGTTDYPTSEATTSLSPTTSPDEVTSRKPRVKFVTLTPGVVVTTDVQGEDSITMSSQHVQKVTKAPTQLPNDLLTSVFGKLEEKTSSPIPDILKDVGNEVEGDGLTAALARRIIALAMERAKSTTSESMPTTVSATTPAVTTTVTSSTSTTTTTRRPASKKKQSTRTVPNSATDASQQNAIVSLPVGEDLQNVLQQLLAAQQSLQPAAQQSVEPAVPTVKQGSTTIATPNDMEKTVENQIRLAEQVRKASRTMKKKKKKKTTTTPAPPFRLGFLFNFFNRPSPLASVQVAEDSTRSPKKLKTASSTAAPTLAAQVLSSSPPDFNDGLDGIDEAGPDSNSRGQLLTAAIDVTKAVSKFMGTVMNNAAQSFQTFVRGWGR